MRERVEPHGDLARTRGWVVAQHAVPVDELAVLLLEPRQFVRGQVGDGPLAGGPVAELVAVRDGPGEQPRLPVQQRVDVRGEPGPLGGWYLVEPGKPQIEVASGTPGTVAGAPSVAGIRRCGQCRLDLTGSQTDPVRERFGGARAVVPERHQHPAEDRVRTQLDVLRRQPPYRYA